MGDRDGGWGGGTEANVTKLYKYSQNIIHDLHIYEAHPGPGGKNKRSPACSNLRMSYDATKEAPFLCRKVHSVSEEEVRRPIVAARVIYLTSFLWLLLRFSPTLASNSLKRVVKDGPALSNKLVRHFPKASYLFLNLLSPFLLFLLFLFTILKRSKTKHSFLWESSIINHFHII